MSDKRIVTDKTFNCQRAGSMVRFTVTEVSLHSGGGGIPAAIAHAPKCSGYPSCGAFPVGFPQELGAISTAAKTGCPFFDNPDAYIALKRDGAKARRPLA